MGLENMAQSNWTHPTALTKHAKALKGNKNWYVFFLECLLAAYPEDEVFRRALAAETGGEVGGVDCIHYWVIETPNGPVSRGICKYCGAVRLFINAYTVALEEVPYGKMLNLVSNRRRR